MSTDFWRSKSLVEMTRNEWEAVCDGCGKCCLQQLQDEDTKQLMFTDVACNLLDTQTCRCSDYENRSQRVPQCMTLTPENVAECAEFAPSSCAYRLLVEGQPLPTWHHLRSGDRNDVHSSGNSVAGKVRQLPASDEIDLQEFLVDWP